MEHEVMVPPLSWNCGHISKAYVTSVKIMMIIIDENKQNVANFLTTSSFLGNLPEFAAC